MKNRTISRYITALAAALIVSATTSTSSAQLIVPSDLKRCLGIGLESNYELQIIKGEQRQAENNATYRNSGALPTVDLYADYDVDADNVSTHYTSDTAEKYFSNTLTADFGVGLSWTMFDGFEIRTNHKRLKEIESQSKVVTRIAIEDYIANLTAEYYNYIHQQNRLQNLNMAVELSKERLRIVRARYMVGNFSRLDYQQASVDFNVDSADYIKQREVLKSSAIKLNEMMTNHNTNATLEIRDSIITVDSSLDYKELLYAMESNNAELLIAEYDTSISRLNQKIIMSRDYPYATLSADYAYYNYNYSRGTTKSIGRLGVDATISVGMTLFDPQKRTDKRNATIAIANAQLNEKDVALKLNSQFNDLWQAYVNNLGLLHLEKSSLGAAKENFEIAMERYMLGNLSGIEMREAQKSLLDAEDRILNATFDTKVCEISLLQISGEITRYLGE